MQKKVITINIFRSVDSKAITIKWISNVMSENKICRYIILKSYSFRIFVKWNTIDKIDGNKTNDIRINDFLNLLINIKNIEDRHVIMEKDTADWK